MKGLVLAGGKGNSLWPLSRGNYPKQFMNIRENRSLFQEAVARNMPFCEEFLIVTNKEYHFIVENQMQIFRGVKYRCFLEEEGKGTCSAITIAAMCCNPSELIYVVPSDQVIEGGHYKEVVTEAQKLAREGNITLLGAPPEEVNVNYGYIKYKQNHVLQFVEKPPVEDAEHYISEGNYLWNTGNFVFCVRDFLYEMSRVRPKLFDHCNHVVKQLNLEGKIIYLPAEKTQNIPVISVDYGLFEHSEKLKVVEADYLWCDVGSFEAFERWNQQNDQNVISENCKNTQVINESSSRLVMVNNIEDALVVNTDDAILITSKAEASRRKRVIHEYGQKYASFFENSNIYHRAWGTYENLTRGQGYKVKKVTLLPGKAFGSHRHEKRSEQWSIVRGTATVTLNGKMMEYSEGSSVFVPVGIQHCIENQTEKEVIIIEVSLGEDIIEEDTITLSGNKLYKNYDKFIKLEPAFQDYLWGGTKLRDVYHKMCDYDCIAESWELSAHAAGQSVVAEGAQKGMLFGEYLNHIDKNMWGWKCQAMERFPLLIKFIDAKENLSIQVHPDDEYALAKENEYGKNEMWHIVDCEKNAVIYCGLKEGVSIKDLERELYAGDVLKLLNRIPVKKGDTFFISAGTIHAIGAGILVCEIQQNSNITYRLYDYHRKDEYGKERELHVDQSLEIMRKMIGSIECRHPAAPEEVMGGVKQLLGECKYFESIKYTVQDELKILTDESSFLSIVFLEGTGQINCFGKEYRYIAGDSFFACAQKGELSVKGSGAFICTRV